jgi:transcriptional antiterminator RfaH
VSRLVCNGDEPAPVPPAVVTALQGREDAGGFVQLEQRPRFAPGERVRIVDGVFADSLGLFEGMADRERVAILLDLLGRKVRILLDEGAIMAA